MLAFAALLLIWAGWMLVCANVVVVRRAEVYLRDLPPAFEGKTILYVSDIDISGADGAKKAGRLVMQLQLAQPDLFILGGDYSAQKLLQVLEGEPRLSPEDIYRRNEFFHYISSFSAPMGKYAIIAQEDGDALEALLDETGYAALNDHSCCFTIGDDKLWLVGIARGSSYAKACGQSFRSGECVIAVSDSPECFPKLNTTEARDSGRWVDLCLAGHTHGGQIVLFDESALTLTSNEKHYRYGWTWETGVPMLTTSGLGCENLPLRFGTHAEAWLIRLTGRGK